MPLICLDFDETLSDAHVHNTLTPPGGGPLSFWNEANLTPDELKKFHDDQWNAVAYINPTGDWASTIRGLLEEGNQIAITSWSAYPHIIHRFLKEKIGLTDEQMAQVHIVAELLKDEAGNFISAPSPLHAKQLHIAKAKDHFEQQGFHYQPEEIMLIDDNRTHCDAAINANHVGIQVEKCSKYNAETVYWYALYAKQKLEWDRYLLANPDQIDLYRDWQQKWNEGFKQLKDNNQDSTLRVDYPEIQAPNRQMTEPPTPDHYGQFNERENIYQPQRQPLSHQMADWLQPNQQPQVRHREQNRLFNFFHKVDKKFAITPSSRRAKKTKNIIEKIEKFLGNVNPITIKENNGMAEIIFKNRQEASQFRHQLINTDNPLTLSLKEKNGVVYLEMPMRDYSRLNKKLDTMLKKQELLKKHFKP